MSQTYINAMMLVEAVISGLLVVTIILQSGDEGMGGFFGGSGSSGGESFRTKRGLEKLLYRTTLVLAIMFTTFSFLIVKYTN